MLIHPEVMRGFKYTLIDPKGQIIPVFLHGKTFDCSKFRTPEVFNTGCHQ